LPTLQKIRVSSIQTENGHQRDAACGVPGIKGVVPPKDRPGVDAPGRIAKYGGSAMALNLNQKKEVVAELAEVAATAHSLVAAEYAGLTVEQLTSMRKKARAEGVYLKVAKNTLVSRAVEDTDYAIVADELTGPLLYAFSKEDPGAAGRLIKEFAKANDKLKPRLVAIGGQKYPGTHVDVLASLPTRDEALSMLLSVMVQPATMLVRVLAEPASQVARATNAVGQQKAA
jgi:large subunit ribosomal protein L10